MDGILIVNKPQNCTSHDVVYKVKKITNQKVGHTGTLDPMATGVLPLLIGKGTLCSKYLIEHDKIYKATIQLGKRTTTSDQEGEIIEEQEVGDNALEFKYITEKLKEFLGKQIQTPPIYSAIKVNGKKLYEYARKGQNIEVPKREIEIYEIELLNVDKQNKKIEYKVHCSKGTYIRSLCEDIAKKLGTIGYMASLERLKVGKFMLEDSISIDNLENDNIEAHIIPIEEIFKNSDKIELNHRKLELFLNGVKLTQKFPDGVYRIYCENKFIGTGIIKENLLKRDVII